MLLNILTAVLIIGTILIIANYVLKAHATCQHDWVAGKGWINVGPGVQVYYEGERCTKCLHCKDAPDIVEYHEHG